MTERFAQRFIWQVLILHILFLAIFFFSVRFARGDAGGPITPDQGRVTVTVPGHDGS